ncbi:MAG: trypsin-like peptidase domain-containing protein [Fimbriimonadaceae bacterium]|nr:trypsin-like peptidase domain-containing protein [Fimbriimonadaceae bacterium]
MRRLNVRDVVAGLVIVFLVGLLVGQKIGGQRAPVSAAAAQAAPPSAPSTVGELRQVSDSFAQIAAAVTPAVVNISSTRVMPGQAYFDPFREFAYGDGWTKAPDQTSQSLGSGVVISADGLVVTNNHNIEDAAEVRVSLADSREFVAEILGRDPLSDIAVLRIKGDKLPVAEWGDSESLRVGEWVIAVGNPFGFNQTVTAGIVSAKGRHDVGVSDFEEFIQTDAAINPGNSGGALIDINGKLVGINTAIFSKTGGYQGIGFAIPAKIARANAEQLLQHGRIVRGWIGLIARPLNSRQAAELQLPTTKGALVVNLYRGQPALKAGLQQFDVVTAVDGQIVESPRDLRLAVAAAKAGSSLELKLVRQGQTRTVKIAVADHPEQNGEPVPGI